MLINRAAAPDSDVRVAIRRLGAEDALAFRALRLVTLRECPSAFRASSEREQGQSLEAVAERLSASESFVLGAWCGEQLAGTAGINRESGAKCEHKCLLWGMYVLPAFRGRGIGQQLGRELLTHAARTPGISRINLAVTTDNRRAVSLYESLGFKVYGREPAALQVDGTMHDQWLMSRSMP